MASWVSLKPLIWVKVMARMSATVRLPIMVVDRPETWVELRPLIWSAEKPAMVVADMAFIWAGVRALNWVKQQ